MKPSVGRLVLWLAGWLVGLSVGGSVIIFWARGYTFMLLSEYLLNPRSIKQDLTNVNF